ncbi:MAG: tetratricopeptide repeat protein, partial [Candidatus Eremiobacteraeota bacterium]|nr:tetratricopeptide repeat protein [Candidatus Eremiobacteraeota bacterium]
MTGNLRCSNGLLWAEIILLVVLVSCGGIILPGCTRPGHDREANLTWLGHDTGARDKPTDTSVVLNNIEDIKKRLKKGSLNLDRAWEILNPELRENPDDVNLLYLKAGLLWQAGKIKESSDVLDEIIARDPGNQDALVLKARICLDHFRNNEAKKVIERLVKIIPGEVKCQLLKAEVLIRLQDYNEAEAVLKKLVDKYPDNIDSYMWLIELYSKSRRHEEGIKFIRRALEKDWPHPEKSRLLTGLGELLEGQGKLKEAVECFETSLDLDPHNIGARGKLAMSMIELSRPVRAMAEVEKLKGSKITDPYQLFVLAQLHFNNNQPSLGKLYLYRALEKFPLEITGYKILGYITFNDREYKEAQKAYLRAKVLWPDDYDALMGEALIDLVRRDFESAKKILSSLDPPEHRMAEHYRRLGDVYMDHLRDYRTAREYYKKASDYLDREEKLKKEAVMALIGLGRIELENDNEKKAEEYFNRALAEAPVDIYIYIEIINAIILEQKFEMAKRYITRWEKANPL